MKSIGVGVVGLLPFSLSLVVFLALPRILPPTGTYTWKMEEFLLPVAGQVAGMLARIRPTGDLVRQIADEATEITGKLEGAIGPL